MQLDHGPAGLLGPRPAGRVPRDQLWSSFRALASTVQRMLLDIDAVGADLEWLPSGTGGVTLVVRDTAMSGH